MFDTEKFIYAVKRRPAIWDPKHPCYSDKESKFDAWYQIGRAFHTGWELLTDPEKQQKVGQFATKWKSIRDQFKKTLNTIQGKKVSTSRNYVYFDLLRFLDPVVAESEMSLEVEEEPVPKKYKLDQTVNVILEINPSNSDNSSSSHTNINKVTETPHEKEVSDIWRVKKAEESMEEALLTMLAKAEEQEKKRFGDEDLLFFQSLLPSIKKMSRAVKLKTRIDILQIVHKNLIECGVDDDTENGLRIETSQIDSDIVVEDNGFQFKMEPFMEPSLKSEPEED